KEKVGMPPRRLSPFLFGRKRIEVALKNQRHGHGMVILVVAQYGLRYDAGAALVDKGYGQAITAMQLDGKVPAAQGCVLLPAFRRKRQADNKAVGLPFFEYTGDCLKTLLASHGPQHLQRPGLSGQSIANGDTDLLQAVVKCEQFLFRYGPHRRTA